MKISSRDINYAEDSLRKRKGSDIGNQAVDCILMDLTGPIKATCWGSLARELCNIWGGIEQQRSDGEAVRNIIDFSKLRVVKTTKNQWNGEILTPMCELSSIEAIGAETGTVISVLDHATAENMLTMTFAVPPAPYCISSFQSLKTKLCGDFRITLRGIIIDLEDLEYAKKIQ